VAGAALVFIGAAMLFVPRIGIEADEATIGNGIYEHGAPSYSWHVHGYEIPVMLISYLGALKTWLYNPMFALWDPGPVSLRLPMVLVGAVTLWLFFRFLDRTVGRRAAWIGTLLLATDTSFVLVEATDFGFVALQFFFKLSALLLLLRFHRDGALWTLAAAFFLLGLALWDKAVFAWVLFGLAVAGVSTFPRELRRHLTARNLSVAVGAMLMGALPLVIYNIARPLETLRANAKVEREPLRTKIEALRQTLDGHVLFGFMTSNEPGSRPGQPRRWYQRTSLWLSAATRYPRRNLTLWASLAAALSLAFFWRTDLRRPMLFGLVALIGTWLPMALTAGAGAAAHHVILLWPFHFLVLAVVLDRTPVRVAAALTILLCAVNLAITNQYYADLIRNGSGIRFTDAIYTLDEYLARAKAPSIFIADWGMVETLNLLSEGETPVVELDTNAAAARERILSDPRNIFVAHTPDNAVFPETRVALEDRARREGYKEEPIGVIPDHNGRVIFEIFRFRKIHL